MWSVVVVHQQYPSNLMNPQVLQLLQNLRNSWGRFPLPQLNRPIIYQVGRHPMSKVVVILVFDTNYRYYRIIVLSLDYLV